MKPVFLSYSSLDIALANEIDMNCYNYGVNIVRDVRDLNPLDNIQIFMDKIKQCDFAITLISENYLKSKNCLYEFTQFVANPDFEEKLLPVMLPGFSLNDKTLKSITNEKSSFLIRIKKNIKKLFDRQIDKKDDYNSQLLQVWKVLSDTKLFDFQFLYDTKYKSLYSTIGVDETDINTAIAEIEKIENEEQQEVAILKLKKEFPGSHLVDWHMAGLFAKQKRFSKAEFHYQEYLNKHPKLLNQIFGLTDLGICYFMAADDDKSIESHKKAIALAPDIAFRSWGGLGDVYFEKNMIDEAVECYLKAKSILPEKSVLNNLILIEHRRKNFEKSIKYCNELIQLKSDDPDFYFALKQAYIGSNQIEEAEKTIKFLYENFPQYPKGLTAYAVMLAANIDKLESKLKFKNLENIRNILIDSFLLDEDYLPTRVWLAKLLVINYRFSNNKKEEDIDFLLKTLNKTKDMLTENIQGYTDEENKFFKENTLSDLKDVKKEKKTFSGR